MVRTGKLPHMHLPDALERLDFGRAYMLSKTQAERQKLVRRWGDGLIKRFADSLIEVRRWIEDMPLPSAYLKQQLAGALYRSSTIRSALEAEVKQRYAERAFKAVTKTAKVTGMDADLVKKMVGTWMTAVYAPKANTYLISKDRAALIAAQRTGDPAAIAKAQQDLADRIADINQPAGFNGTFKRGAAGGLSNADAAQLVSEIEAQIDPQLLRDIAAPIYEMMAWKRAEDIKSGKVTRAMVASWPNHPDYVPLTGDPRYNPETDDAFHAGNHLNQDKDYAINGRKDSVADDAFDAAFAAVAKSINFASIQPFKKHLAAAYDEAQQRGIDIGLTREAVTGMTRLGDDVVIYRDAYTLPNGQQKLVSYAFRFADERVIKSLKRENEESANRFLTVLATPTRWYARFVTQMTATFAPINFVRDVWERSEFLRTRTLVKSNGQPVDVKAAARMSIAESMNPKVMRAAFASSFKTGAMTPERADLEQFIRLGGSSTLGDALPRTASTLERDIRRMMPGALDKVTGGNWSKAGDKAMWLIEGYNNGFELIPAFATFRALKAQGMTAEDAASAVLDLMNFRKKGTYMPAIRALYVFAQPAATSGYNLIQALSTKTGQKRFLAYAMTGALVYAFLRGLVWDDEDEEVIGNKLDNLSNFTVERTIPIRIGDTVVKLPIGFGMPQLAWSLAVNSNRVASGRYTLGEAVAEQIKGGVKSMAPVAPSEMELMERPVDFMVQTITPTLLRPIFNVYADQTAFGQRLTPAFKDPDKLKAETFRRSVPPQFVEAAQWMHDTLGLDVYPDHLKAISDGYLIGPARVLMTQLVDNPGKVFRGEPEKWAVLGSIVDNINDRQLINSVYYRIRGDLEEVNREYEYRAREGKLAGWMTPDRMKDVQAFKQFEASEKALSRPRASAYKARGVVPDAALSPTVQAIESQSDLMHKQLIQQYLKGK